MKYRCDCRNQRQKYLAAKQEAGVAEPAPALEIFYGKV